MYNLIRLLIVTIVSSLFIVACTKTSGSTAQGGGGTTPTPPKPPAPTITAIHPDTAAPGATITLLGTNFDTTLLKDTVQFGGGIAKVTTATATQLVVVVPMTVTTGNVTITTSGGTSPGVGFTVAQASNKPTVYVLGTDTRDGWGFWINAVFNTLSDCTSGYDLKGSGSDIYIAGPSTAGVPTYWKNSTAVHLSTQTGYTWSIFLSGSDVYNLGIINNNFYVWKNGTPTQLTTNSTITTVYQGYYSSSDLFVSNGDTYAAAARYLGNSTILKATYWKNGSPVDLTDGIHTGPAWATAIAVSGNDVYVGGIEQIQNAAGGIVNTAPRLWKNGVSIPIAAPTVSLTNSISCLLVNGNDVYMGGQYNGAGAVWKNGSLLDSAKYAVAEHVSSIFLYNNTDLYISGASSAWGLNCYWINGNMVEMDPGCHGISNSCAGTSANQSSAIYVK
jgi:hypothetical protein